MLLKSTTFLILVLVIDRSAKTNTDKENRYYCYKCEAQPASICEAVTKLWIDRCPEASCYKAKAKIGNEVLMWKGCESVGDDCEKLVETVAPMLDKEPTDFQCYVCGNSYCNSAETTYSISISRPALCFYVILTYFVNLSLK